MLLTALQIILKRWSGEEDVSVGIQVSLFGSTPHLPKTRQMLSALTYLFEPCMRVDCSFFLTDAHSDASRTVDGARQLHQLWHPPQQHRAVAHISAAPRADCHTAQCSLGPPGDTLRVRPLALFPIAYLPWAIYGCCHGVYNAYGCCHGVYIASHLLELGPWPMRFGCDDVWVVVKHGSTTPSPMATTPHGSTTPSSPKLVWRPGWLDFVLAANLSDRPRYLIHESMAYVWPIACRSRYIIHELVNDGWSDATALFQVLQNTPAPNASESSTGLFFFCPPCLRSSTTDDGG